MVILIVDGSHWINYPLLLAVEPSAGRFCDAFSIHPALQGRLQFRPGRFRTNSDPGLMCFHLSIETNDFTMFDCLIMFDML